MENKSLEESSDSENEALTLPFSENEALGESPDNGDVIEAWAEAQRLAILEVFGESSDSENEALGESSDNGDVTEARAEAQRRAILEAFGESSDSEDELGEEATSHRWEMVEGIKGLWLCRDFLSAEHQFLLMQAIQREGWFEGSDNNQGMRFGDLPEWATELSRSIWEAVCFAKVVGEETTEDSCMEGACPLPVDILSRVPLFDQLIINVYQPGEGICAHVDLMRFDDGIAIVSLESSCVMHFTRCEQEADATEVREGDVSPSTRIAVYLTPGSLVVLSGEARYLWKHEINRKPGFQMWEEREIKQEKRTSVTLRKLLQQPDES